ncbi:MAG: FkbM family methyltransferase [Rikenellaceae bacterium]
MNRLIHKILYRTLSLNGYLKVVSGMLFLLQRLGWGRYNPSTEYIFHLPRLIAKGGVAIDIGANLGYYTRKLSAIVGAEGHVYGVEPVPPIFEVLRHNTRHCKNVTLHNVALGTEYATITMANDSVSEGGYFGTGQNFVNESNSSADVEFEAKMVRGSELFSTINRIDLIKCDIEGYECVVMEEIRPIIERHRPTILIESGGENRAKIIDMFTQMGYKAYTLHRGAEVPLEASSVKDIIFRY